MERAHIMSAVAPEVKKTTSRQLREFKYYELLVNAFVVILLISNLVAQKLVKIGSITIGPWHFDLGSIAIGTWHYEPTLSCAQLLFPITYIFGDIFTEVYGYAGSRRAIWVGFGSSALLALIG